MTEQLHENILVRGVNWIGDAVMTMPALRALRRAFPEAKISLLVKPSVAPLFEGSRAIDDIILYEERFRGIAGRLELSGMLRSKRFSKAILLQNAFDAALLAFLAGVPERIGYRRDGRGLLLTKPVAFNGDDRRIHHIQYYLNLLEAAGIATGDPQAQPWIPLSSEERMSARSKLKELKRPLLGINPGAAYGSAKRWPPERFAEVADRFAADTGGSVVIFGGKGEAGLAQEIERATQAPALLLAGKTSLRGLIALISECDILVSNDSGPMHIAYAVGTPLVAIFGSTDPGLTGPVGEASVVVKSDVPCSPCFERTCKDKGLKCMLEITADDVYSGVKKLLPRRRAVFFDRDGTLCRDAHFLHKWDDLEVFPDIGSVRELKEKGYMLIGVSNQSGIRRGLVDESFVKEVNGFFIDKYGFDDFYYCAHGPDEHCPCRKPEPALLHAARAKYGINLKESFMVGDKDADMLLAKAVGARAILVRTGKQKESAIADFTADNLKEVVAYIGANG